MIGAIIGDIVGSRFEWVDHCGKDFIMFTGECRATDDTFMTLAVANALILCKKDYTNLSDYARYSMKKVAHDHPNTGWGGNFYKWLFLNGPDENSYGNGAGMRISPVGWVAKSMKEVIDLTYKVTVISHNHEQGHKGALAISMAVYLARIGKDKDYIRKKLSKYYPILLEKTFSIENLIGKYGYDEAGNWVTCQGSVPQAIVAFLDGSSFEDVIRNAVSIGGDSDTIAAMAGSIAEAYYGVDKQLEEKALSYLSDDLLSIYHAFRTIKLKRNTKKCL